MFQFTVGNVDTVQRLNRTESAGQFSRCMLVSSTLIEDGEGFCQQRYHHLQYRQEQFVGDCKYF